MTELMTAGRVNTITRELSVERVPVPDPGPGQVRIRVRAAGVCLSDVHFLGGSVSAPVGLPEVVTFGHEVAGTVDVVGDGVVGHRPGGRVVVHPVVYAGGRRHTLGLGVDGGWAEYLVVPADTLVPIDDSLPFEIAAIIPDAVSTPWAAIVDGGRVRPAESVGVWGVGGLGVHAVQLLRLVGAAPVVAMDPDPIARGRALAVGADAALDPSAEDFADVLREATRGRGLDVAFDVAGSPTAQAQAMAALRRNARLVLVGMSGGPLTVPDSTNLIAGERRIIGHYGSNRAHVLELVRLLELGRLDLSGSVSGTLPLADVAEAVRRLDERVDSPVRLVLQP